VLKKNPQKIPNKQKAKCNKAATQQNHEAKDDNKLANDRELSILERVDELSDRGVIKKEAGVKRDQGTRPRELRTSWGNGNNRVT